MDEKDTEKGLAVVARNQKGAFDVNLFNQVLPRGDYVAQVEDSDVTWDGFKATLLLRLICRNKWGLYKTTLTFRIHDPDQGKQERAREKVGDLGAAMGVCRFDDSDQLHGIPFKLTVWNDWRDKPMRFTCRPAPKEMVSGGQRQDGGAAGEMGQAPRRRSSCRVCADVML